MGRCPGGDWARVDDCPMGVGWIGDKQVRLQAVRIVLDPAMDTPQKGGL